MILSQWKEVFNALGINILQTFEYLKTIKAA